MNKHTHTFHGIVDYHPDLMMKKHAERVKML